MKNNIKKRIDVLGRIVLPKQIRDELKINDNDELEIFVKDDTVVLKKTIELIKFKEKFDRILYILKEAYKLDFLIINDSKIISSSNKNIKFGDIVSNINFDMLINNELVNFKINDINLSYYIFLDRLIFDSNILGYLIILNKSSLTYFYSNIEIVKKIILDFI